MVNLMMDGMTMLMVMLLMSADDVAADADDDNDDAMTVTPMALRATGENTGIGAQEPTMQGREILLPKALEPEP